MRDEEITQLRTALDALGPEAREVLVLRYGDGLRHQEIAELLDLRVDTVKQRASPGAARAQGEDRGGAGERGRRTYPMHEFELKRRLRRLLGGPARLGPDHARALEGELLARFDISTPKER